MEIVGYYQELYAETKTWSPEFNMTARSSITEEKEWLQRDIDQTKVLEGLKLYVADKTPGIFCVC